MGDPKARFYKEGDIKTEATYQPKFDNPDWYSRKDLMLYLIVNPLARNSEFKIDLSYTGSKPSKNTNRN